MFIQIFQGRCTRQDELRAALERWLTDVRPGAEGWLGGTYGFTDDDTFIGVVRFESEEMARRNSARPEQDRWWQETRTLFDGDVEFHNCRDTMMLLEGGSDEAGFVQILRGKVDDPDRLREVMARENEMTPEVRPDIIGATLGIEEDGTFTETVFFTDEATARENEAKQMPPELADWKKLATVHDVEFMDLHRPFYASPG
jgi:hypothetical protein